MLLTHYGKESAKQEIDMGKARTFKFWAADHSNVAIVYKMKKCQDEMLQ